jgi:hypothetical protein
MDQESSIQAFLVRHKNPAILSILGELVRTPEGRNKLATSMIHPVRLAIDYLESTRKPLSDIEYPMESRVTEYRRFIATVPEDEQKADPFPELEASVNQLQALIEKRKSG